MGVRFSTGCVSTYVGNGCGGPDLPEAVPEGGAFRTWYLLSGARNQLISRWDNGDVWGSDFREAGGGDLDTAGGADYPDQGQDDFTDQAEAERHHRLATQAFGLRFDPALPVAAERNVLSLTSAETCFAQRLDCRRLACMVANGWRAPAAAAAEIESVEAGIVHTPAVGYFFDMHAAIRVVHRSLEPTIGRKPTYHLDRHGEPVLLRRTAELIREPVQGPRAEARAGAQ